jgi:hypothetical protein
MYGYAVDLCMEYINHFAYSERASPIPNSNTMEHVCSQQQHKRMVLVCSEDTWNYTRPSSLERANGKDGLWLVPPYSTGAERGSCHNRKDSVHVEVT